MNRSEAKLLKSLTIGFIAISIVAWMVSQALTFTVNRSFLRDFHQNALQMAATSFLELNRQNFSTNNGLAVSRNLKQLVVKNGFVFAAIIQSNGEVFAISNPERQEVVSTNVSLFNNASFGELKVSGTVYPFVSIKFGFDGRNQDMVLVLAGENQNLSRTIGQNNLGTSLVFSLGFVVLVFFVVSGLRRRLLPLSVLSHAVCDIDLDKQPMIDIGYRGQDEISDVVSAFNRSLNKIFILQTRIRETARRNAISEIAAQVAHDIRSPLAALDNVMSTLKELPEDDRIVVRSAINRIKDIANNLIDKNRELKATLDTSLSASRTAAVSVATSASPSSTIESASLQLLSSLIDPLITEKRMQFRSRLNVEISGHLGTSSYGLFANVQPTEFKRVLSNLINNAVEALNDKGTVTVELSLKNSLKDHRREALGGPDVGQIQITVSDNGKGIAPEILANLGRRGQTHGKQGGSGLGLYHARTTIELWGGNLQIESQVGKGTSVVLTLPQAKTPEWFVGELKLIPQTTVVILDDDSSIHGIWQGRLDSLRVNERQIEVLHFSTPDEFTKWVTESPASRTALYLADYELLGHKETGLDLIEKLQIGPQSVLVTSRFEEEHIRQNCERLKVRLIPKGMAGFVPIFFEQPLERPDCVLIDDDILVHMSWKRAAKKSGKNVLFFENSEEFFTRVSTLHQATPVYIDSALGNGVKGEIIAKQLFEMGFKELWLCTGFSPENFSGLPYLRGVVGKNPPWNVA